MAKGKKTGGRNFKPGEGGRKPLPPEVKVMRALTHSEFTSMMGKYSRLSREEMLAIEKDPNTPILELCVLKVLSKALDEGDPKYVNWLTERLYGRVKEKVEISTPKPTYIDRLDGTFVELGTTLEAEVVDPPEER